MDASAAAAVIFREPDAEAVGAHLFGAGGVVVPHLFPLEVANVGRTKVLMGELAWAAARRLLHTLDRWPMRIVQVTWRQAWPLAHRHGLTLYDAAYFYLVRSRRLQLLSLDQQLCRVAGTRSLL